MRMDCLIHRSKGQPLVTPREVEVTGYHVAEGEAMIGLADGSNLHLLDAFVHHTNSMESKHGFVLGIDIRGVEPCSDLGGALVAQEVWLRARA